MRLLGLALMFVLGMSHATLANDFFPMCPGSVWEYADDETSAPYVKECVGWEDIWGVRCGVIEYLKGPDAGLRNFWYDAADGVLMLRGFFRPQDGFGFLYEPGIPMISASPFLGEEFCVSVDAFHLPDSTYSDSWSFCQGIVEEGFLDLPAGTFYAYGLGGRDEGLGRGDYDLLGRRIRSPQRGNAWIWFTEHVGEVRSTSIGSYSLADYSLPPSSLDVTSWGRVKALYVR